MKDDFDLAEGEAQDEWIEKLADHLSVLLLTFSLIRRKGSAGIRRTDLEVICRHSNKISTLTKDLEKDIF